MKKSLFLLVALVLSTAVFAQDAVKIKVTGDRVSMRAAPELNAVLLDRAMLGDELILKDNSNPDWVGIQPPDSVDLWVDSSFVSSNTVMPEILNIRSGPSLSHSVVGAAHKGDALAVRSEVAQWLKIAPTTNTTIWINRKYVDAPKVVLPETQTVAQAVSEPTVQEIMLALSSASQKKLTVDPVRPQGNETNFYGKLMPANPGLYKLVDDHFTDVTVCYVRGNSAQMQTFSGMKLEMSGKTYWAKELDLPILKPARIRLIPTGEVK